MFSEIVDVKNCCSDDALADFLYKIFKTDFIDNSTYLANKIYIDPKSKEKIDGKENIFWHVITRTNQRTKQREFDEERACRIKWIKKIIVNHGHSEIKLFYNYEKNRQVRLYLWAYNFDFIVIIQKLGKKSSYLVTSFYIDKNYNINIYNKRYEAYLHRKDMNLKDCEWF